MRALKLEYSASSHTNHARTTVGAVVSQIHTANRTNVFHGLMVVGCSILVRGMSWFIAFLPLGSMVNVLWSTIFVVGLHSLRSQYPTGSSSVPGPRATRSRSASPPRCAACDRNDCPAAAGGPCPKYKGMGRGAHPDARAKTKEEVAAEQAASRAPLRLVEGTIVPQDGSGLACFYNTILAGLNDLKHPRAPADVVSLRGALARCLRSPTAATLRLPSGKTLLEFAAQEETTLANIANAVEGRFGRLDGMGGTELLPVVAHLYSVALTTCRAPAKHGTSYEVIEEQQLPAGTHGEGAIHLALERSGASKQCHARSVRAVPGETMIALFDNDLQQACLL